MKIIITGASGNIATKLIPCLIKNKCDLILVSRDKNKLKNRYPDLFCLSYEEIKSYKEHVDIMLHLATANTNASDINVHKETNVNFLSYVYDIYEGINIDYFINISSIHALDLHNNTAYAKTKREAVSFLKDKNNPSCKTLYLPYVYNSNLEHTGKLKILNYLPLFINKFLFSLLKSCKRSLNIVNLNNLIINKEFINIREDVVSDDIDNNLIYIITKKMTDILFVLFIGIFFGWLLLLIWMLVKIESPGPGIFKQERVGKDNKLFTCYKFRTMTVNTKEVPSHFIKENQITRMGRVLRKYKIDELPQIINILKNEISLIGPRPCLPSQTFLIEERNKYETQNIKPGISGLSQVYGIDMSRPRELSLWDCRYKSMRSLHLDIKIIIYTVLKLKR